MRQLLFVLAAATLVCALAQKSDNPFAGRWNMTVTRANEKFPSWMEVVEENGDLQVRIQGRTGNVNPVAAAEVDGSRLLITVSGPSPASPASENRPATPPRPALAWVLTASDGKLTGTQTRGENVWQLSGVRAPALKRDPPRAWTSPEPLFNGKDLSGWEPINNTPGIETAANNWIARDGELVNTAKGSNLRTTRTFDDFKLHVEYNCPQGENSGIYLRGRYEAQVTAPPAAGRPSRRPGGAPGNPFLGVGCIYGFLGPSEPPPFKPDWQTYDITLVGRMVTVIFNGVTTIRNEEIPGITGGAIDSDEAAPGPIYLQGDHHGGIRYRNITVSVPRR